MKAIQLINNTTSIAFIVAVGLTTSLFAEVYIVDQKTTGGAIETEDLSLNSCAQSFTPTLSAVGFIDVLLKDLLPGNGIGSKVSLKLRDGTVDGPVLATSPTLNLPDGYPGGTDVTRFLFATNVAVHPNQLYFLEPVLLSGDPAGFQYYHLGYARGDQYVNGRKYGVDFWFQEGIVQPEFASVTFTNRVTTVSWLGGGILEESTNILGAWFQVPGNLTNTFQMVISGPELFFRVRR